jgi:hypothetical protein
MILKSFCFGGEYAVVWWSSCGEPLQVRDVTVDNFLAEKSEPTWQHRLQESHTGLRKNHLRRSRRHSDN